MIIYFYKLHGDKKRKSRVDHPKYFHNETILFAMILIFSIHFIKKAPVGGQGQNLIETNLTTE